MAVPFIVAAVLGGAALFTGGAYVGTVVENATDSPEVVIQQATVTDDKNKSLTNRQLLLYGGLGIAAYFIYKKLWRR